MPAPLRLCLATQNRHKVTELQALIETLMPQLAGRLQLVSLAELGVHDEVIEDGETFAENARIKAEAAHQRTGLWSLADDSGLMVDALGGAPGVHSARYGGEPRSDARNMAVLITTLGDVPTAQRTARFVCTLCLHGRDALGTVTRLRSGRCEGILRRDPLGLHGFGYDPLFVPDPAELHAADLPAALCGRTFAELLPEQKNGLSHRARALLAMGPLLLALCAGHETGEPVTPLRRLPDSPSDSRREGPSNLAHDGLPSAALLG